MVSFVNEGLCCRFCSKTRQAVKQSASRTTVTALFLCLRLCCGVNLRLSQNPAAVRSEKNIEDEGTSAPCQSVLMWEKCRR